MTQAGLDNAVDQLLGFLFAHPRLMVLTGAGLSAASGIGTYRDRDGRWLGAAPIQHQEFVISESVRRRYWGRSMIGWPRVRDAQPNLGHQALARLEELGYVEHTITQNVDRLHQRAGSLTVTDLHGRLDRVVCLNCGSDTSREAMQRRLLAANLGVDASEAALRPDGDAAIADTLIAQINVPACEACAGVLKPAVVFFGGAVPRDRVEQGMAALEVADALLVVGSSLQVYSGFRFCRRAVENGIPIAIINSGVTRADPVASLKLAVECGPLLQRATERMSQTAGL